MSYGESPVLQVTGRPRRRTGSAAPGHAPRAHGRLGRCGTQIWTSVSRSSGAPAPRRRGQLRATTVISRSWAACTACQQGWLVAADGDDQQQITGLPQGTHLARQAALPHRYRRWRRLARASGTQGQRRQFGPIALETGHAKGRELLDLRGTKGRYRRPAPCAPLVTQAQMACTAALMGWLRACAAWYFRSALSMKCCWMRCSSMGRE